MVLAWTPPLLAENKFSGPSSLHVFYKLHVWMLACSIFYCPFENGWSGDSFFSSLMNKRHKNRFSLKIEAVPQRRRPLSFPGFSRFPCLPSMVSLLDFCFQANSPSLSQARYQRWHRESEGKKFAKHFPLCAFHLNSIIFFLPPRLNSGQFDWELLF